MGFTVAVVVPPVPARDAEAWAALDELLERRGEGPRSAEFQGLHDRLTARYPCLNSLPPDRRDEGVWSDAPLINNFEHRAAVLGIRPARVQEVLPFLVESATSLGLVVFDEQQGKIYRPKKPRKQGPATGPAAKRNSKKKSK